MHHEPVMINEVINILESHNHSVILDGTLGLGGYSEAILRKFSDSKIIGVDRDSQAISFSRERLKIYEHSSRFKTIHSDFSSIINFQECRNLDAYIFDLGVSNMQLTSSQRGFSFNLEGPLDMRMNPDSQSITAYELLVSSSEQTLARIFYDYGNEKFSRQIAHAIKNSPIPKTTSELVDLIRKTLPQPIQRKMGTHPARRIFQALRIYINNEISELENLLLSLPKISHNAVIIFVSYHSLEDRLIKHSFRDWQTNKYGSVITKHPLTPTEQEIEFNYKARSAKLRAFFLSQD